MTLKRAVRNGASWLLATMLITLGSVKRARRKAFQENLITSIYFHNPDRKLFRKIIIWLERNGYVFLSSEQLVNILNRGMACPRGAVWLSMDDGWKGNMENVIPTAREHNIPITIFISTGAIEDGTFWWRKVKQSRKSLDGRLPDTKAIRSMPERLRKQILDSISQTALVFPREAMTIEDIKNIAAMPQVTLGSHTVSHPFLQNCTEDEIEYELAASRRQLENWTGKSVTTFAYPGGSFDGRERRWLEEYGYELAATIIDGHATPFSDRYMIPRACVMDDGSFAENLCHALGIWEPIVTRLKKNLT